jgi:dihydroflavonol-4-reductase
MAPTDPASDRSGRVMITGATGFIGAHTTRALLEAGRPVTALVRDPARLAVTLESLGVRRTDLEVVVGDMGDPDAVGRAMEGSVAAIHSAAVVSLEKNRGEEVLAANPAGTATVIDAAIDRGLDPILYVSSTASLWQRGLSSLHVELAPAELESAYGRSKSLAEQYVRRRQAEGAPIVITYPASVMGPPAGQAAGEVSAAVATHLQMGWLPLPEASWSIVDVRDLAAVHLAALEAGRGPRRFMCGGTYMTMDELGVVYRRLTGRRFPVVRWSAASLRGLGRMVDALGRYVPVDTIFTGEAMDIFTGWVPTDDQPTYDQLGIAWRDPQETLASSIRGLVDAGRVSATQAGRLGG